MLWCESPHICRVTLHRLYQDLHNASIPGAYIAHGSGALVQPQAKTEIIPDIYFFQFCFRVRNITDTIVVTPKFSTAYFALNFVVGGVAFIEVVETFYVFKDQPLAFTVQIKSVILRTAGAHIPIDLMGHVQNFDREAACREFPTLRQSAIAQSKGIFGLLKIGSKPVIRLPAPSKIMGFSCVPEAGI